MNARIICLACGVALLTSCAREEKKAEAASTAPEPVAIQTAQAESRVLDKAISVTGSLNPDETVTMSFEVPGRISKVYVDFGQNVRQGQTLAELDNRELTYQVDRSKAAVTQALARLGLNPGQENVTPESTPAIRQASAQMEDARSKFNSASQLVKSGDISQERFTELEKAFRARQAALEATGDEMRTQLASIKALQAEVKLAEKRLADTVIRAPFDGAVTQKTASAGQYMKENTPVVTLIKTFPIRLRVDIPESAAGEVKVGTTLTFTTDAAPGAQFRAVVRELNPTLDAKSRSLSAEARLTSNDTRLRPGMFVQVQLVVGRGNKAVMVPKEAVYNIAGLNKVFLIRNGKATELKITPGQELDGWVEVSGAELAAGEQVAISKLPELLNGRAVRVANTPKANKG